MTVTIKQDEVEKYLRAHPTAPVDKVAERFPGVTPWAVRLLRRDILREAALLPNDSPGAAPAHAVTPTIQNAIRAGFFRPVHVTLRDRRPVKPIFKKAGRQTLVLSDVHAPDHDPDALDVATQVGQAVGVDDVVIAGDGADVHALSRYTPAAHRPIRWVDERGLMVPVFAGLREAFPTQPIYWLHGNHCTRPEKFLARQAPQLQGLFTLPELLGIDDLGFIFPEDNRVILADSQLLVTHGTRVRAEAGASVMAEVREHDMSVVMGHVHRLAVYYLTRTAQRLAGRQPLRGVELGCLCNLQPDYLEVERTANWQHGCAVVTVYDSGFYDIEPVAIFRGRAFFRGREFQSRVRAESA
jgi:predicted phosphodiesterase